MSDSGLAGRRIPPHHDPACFGCGDNPFGLNLPEPAAEGLETYLAMVHFSEQHQAGPGLVHTRLVRRPLHLIAFG